MAIYLSMPIIENESLFKFTFYLYTLINIYLFFVAITQLRIDVVVVDRFCFSMP